MLRRLGPTGTNSLRTVCTYRNLFVEFGMADRSLSSEN